MSEHSQTKGRLFLYGPLEPKDELDEVRWVRSERNPLAFGVGIYLDTHAHT